MPGAVAPPRLPPAARDAWLDGMGEALAELPVLALVVTPGAILLAETPVLDGADRSVPEGIHRAGVRALTVFGGAPERELLAIAGLLATDWSARGTPTADLAEALWRAELPHAWFDLPGDLAPPASRPVPLAAFERLEQAAEAPQRLGTLSSDAAGTLRDLRATVVPDPAGLAEGPAATSPVTPELSAEVALVRAGADVDPGELGAALVGALSGTTSPEAAGRLARALLGAAVELLGGSVDAGPLVHAALEASDADLTPDPAIRAAAAAAFAELAQEPLRPTLLAHLPVAEAPELRGPVFSLLSLVRDDAGVTALAEALPRWAVGVLADTVLLRDPEDGQARLDAVRARLASPSPAVAALGLAMAARLDDPRLLDAVLALADHRGAEVREGVLVALRHQALGRVRELALRRLDDPSPAVRIEALRYGVAHRLPEVLPRLEARLQDPALATLDEHEARAVCIAYGRLGKDNAEALLFDLAMGRKKLGPAFVRNALHGLRAIGTPRARAALEHVAAEVPRLRDEATTLLGDAR